MPAGNLRNIRKKIGKKISKALDFISPHIFYGIKHMKGDLVVPVYWYDTVVNFGDLLTPALLRNYGIHPIHSPIGRSKMVVAGSILHILPENYSGYIIGAGLFDDISIQFPYAKILALRGKLTRDRINAPSSTTLGDPGLLADKLIAERQKKQFVLGIVPHHIDKMDERIQNIFQRYKDEILLIDVQRKPVYVISDIDKCNYIISSSLHGTVVADSLGIPNAWTILSGKVRGGGFKFYDYTSAFDMRYEPQYLTGNENLTGLIGMTHNVDEGVQEIKYQLNSVFDGIKYKLTTGDMNG